MSRMASARSFSPTRSAGARPATISQNTHGSRDSLTIASLRPNRTLAGRVSEDPRLLEGHQPFGNHFVENRNEPIHMFLAIDDFDHDWQILGEPKQVGGMENASSAEAGDAPEYGGAGESFP